MEEKIYEIAKKHDIESIVNKIEELNDFHPVLSIALLGEFSSGKSTIINAMIGQNILPSMERPTSKNIIEIIPEKSSSELKYFSKQNDNSLKQISPLEFYDIALGKTKGIGVLECPTNDIFMEGFRFIDTPGQSSLDKTDADITLGYLPFLDGAIICQDINQGGLTQSIVNFLGKKDVKILSDYFIFILTKKDLKEPSAVQKIVEEEIKKIKDLNSKGITNIKDPEKRIIAISPLNILENKDNPSLESLKKMLNDNFIQKRALMEEKNKQKVINGLAGDLLEILEYKADNFSLSDEGLEKAIDDLKSELRTLEKEESKILSKLDALEETISLSIKGIIKNYEALYAGDNNVQDINAKLIKEVYNKSNEILNLYFNDIKLLSISDSTLNNVARKVQSATKYTEIGKTVIMTAIIIVAALFAAPEVTAIATTEATALITVTKGAEVVSKASKALKSLKASDNFFETIHPIDWTMDYIKEQWINRSIKYDLLNAADKISSEIVQQNKLQVLNLYILPIKENMEEKEKQLERSKTDRNRKEKMLENEKNNLRDDIVELKMLTIQVKNGGM